MQNLNFLETELLDIIFRGKNKNYGAYALRKKYPIRVKQALGFALLSIFMLYGVQFVLPKGNLSDLTYTPTIPGGQIKPLGEVEIISTLPAAAAPVFENLTSTQKPTEIIEHQFIDNKEVPKDKPLADVSSTIHTTGVPTTSDLKQAGHGGNGTSKTSTEPTGNPKSSGPATTTITPPVIPDPTPLVIAEFEPEFPGGMDAMLGYIKSKMRYPSLASSNGIEGTVYVQFVVNTNGGISDVTIMKGLGMGCDQEATRVIKSMPKWKPAMNGGQKVNYSFVLPIQFEL